MDRFFWRGRVIAPTHDQAVEVLRAQVEAQGYRLGPDVRLKESPVQPWPDQKWFDTDVELFPLLSGM